jgi:NAD(P)-dependent dehydrogenase (short-subunit alcohol dehydrogenase family)
MTNNGSEPIVTLVTGTSSGLGLLTAVELGRRGVRVFASMRDTTRADDLRSNAEHAGVDVEILPLDVTSEPSVQDAVGQVVRNAGRTARKSRHARFSDWSCAHLIHSLGRSQSLASIRPASALADRWRPTWTARYPAGPSGVGARYRRRLRSSLRGRRGTVTVLLGAVRAGVRVPPIGVACPGVRCSARRV